VVVPSPSAGDNYTIGVWANVSSVFTLIAVAAQDVLTMQLGITYPGVVRGRQAVYYSLYVDPLLLLTALSLQFDLYSFTGDSQLYCSDSSSRPSQWDYMWASLLDGLESYIVLHGSQLYCGFYYCTVRGWASSSSFSFTASLGSVTIISDATA
jgi:hypothetical protein